MMVWMALGPINHSIHSCGLDDCPTVLYIFHHLHANIETKYNYNEYCVYQDRFDIESNSPFLFAFDQK